jgi:hypothetical protein
MAQRIIRKAERTSWQDFVSSLSRSTRSDVLWKKLPCLLVKCNRTFIPGVSEVAPFLQRKTTLPIPSLQICHQSLALAIVILALEPSKTARKLHT